MTRNKILLIAAALVGLAAGWYFASPRWTLWQMNDAAEARDSDRLAAYIDFPTLRETTKAQMKAQLMAKAQQDGGAQGGAASLGAVMGLALIGPVIDSTLTPETMRAAFEKVPAKAQGAARGGSAGVPAGGAAKAAPDQRPLGIDPDNMKIVQKGPNEFRLRKKDAKTEAGDLIFRRHGLGWKLEEVKLPEDALGG